ncbi:hypothetical protein [Streptomyces synnematoformans]|uniref:Uncharacterized protein n=1 Tax=Streptomyces synnematoformans TaxID=415721 RepID=A0ABP5JEL0_9ACTN
MRQTFKRRLPVALATVAASVLGAGLSASGANAATAQVQRADDCVVNVDSGSSQCFGTFREAIAATTHGKITNAPLSAKGIDRKLADRLSAASDTAGAQAVQLGAVFTDSNYGGSSVIFEASSGCRSGNGRDAQLDLSGIWNNSISSLTTLSCWLELWDAPATAGFHQEYRQSTSYVGDAMNDRASSIAFL